MRLKRSGRSDLIKDRREHPWDTLRLHLREPVCDIWRWKLRRGSQRGWLERGSSFTWGSWRTSCSRTTSAESGRALKPSLALREPTHNMKGITSRWMTWTSFSIDLISCLYVCVAMWHWYFWVDERQVRGYGGGSGNYSIDVMQEKF